MRDFKQSRTRRKLEMCPQYTDASALGTSIKLCKPCQSSGSTWYKCLNPSLTGSCMYVRTYTHWYRRTYIRMHVPRLARMDNRKIICPWHYPMRGQKKIHIHVRFSFLFVCQNLYHSSTHLLPVLSGINLNFMHTAILGNGSFSHINSNFCQFCQKYYLKVSLPLHAIILS